MNNENVCALLMYCQILMWASMWHQVCVSTLEKLWWRILYQIHFEGIERGMSVSDPDCFLYFLFWAICSLVSCRFHSHWSSCVDSHRQWFALIVFNSSVPKIHLMPHLLKSHHRKYPPKNYQRENVYNMFSVWIVQSQAVSHELHPLLK